MEFDEFEDFLLNINDDPSLMEMDSFSRDSVADDITVDLLKPQVESALSELQFKYRIPELSGVQEFLDVGNFPELIDAIRSMVGDDEVITTNCLIYAIMCVVIGPLVSMIRVSWEDVQFSQSMYNYAEGWVYLPPNSEASFESVNLRHKGDAVPFVLDGVKFKDLSPVRKQSQMNQDLASKFKNLAQKAAWTNPHWPTWDIHQFALILGIEIFDFMRANIFPYLFKWEGGCGGAPPWNNCHTAAAAIHRFKMGRARIGILGIMHDSNRLHTGEIMPEHAFFTKNLNLAISGDRRWAAIRSELEKRKHDAILNGEEYRPQIVDMIDDIVPPELRIKSATIEPQDTFVGVACSFLREKGYILTESDLVERIAQEERMRAIWGPVPMREIEDQIALRKEAITESFHEKLTQLSAKELHRGVRAQLAWAEDPMSSQSLETMKMYYGIRVKQVIKFNSFIYNERIRVFKLQDVEEYFNRGAQGIKDQFSKDVGSLYRPEFRRSIQTDYDRILYDEVEAWLQSGPLRWLFSNPIPPGIGPDDARIVRTLYDRIEQMSFVKYENVFILVITSDRALIGSAQRYLAHAFPKLKIRVYGLKTAMYLRWCMCESWQVSGRPRNLRIGKPKVLPPWLNVDIFNIVQRAKVKPTGALEELMLNELKWYIGDDEKTCGALIEYDFPNINRGLSRFSRNRITGGVVEVSGGFLRTNTLSADAEFAARPYEEVLHIPDFTRGVRRSVAPITSIKHAGFSFLSGTTLSDTSIVSG